MLQAIGFEIDKTEKELKEFLENSVEFLGLKNELSLEEKFTLFKEAKKDFDKKN